MRQDILASIAKQLWEQALGTEVSSKDNFFRLGGTSLLATEVIFRLAAQVEISPSVVYEALYGTESLEEFFSQLALQSAPIAVGPAIRAAGLAASDRSRPTRLSFAQERLWFLEQMTPGLVVYHVPLAIRIRGSLDQASFQSAVQQLVDRQDALRTHVQVGPAEIAFQKVDQPKPIQFTVDDMCSLDRSAVEMAVEAFLAEEAARPFDLINGPLFRTGLLKLGSNDHVFYCTMHHLISDAWSAGVIVRDLSELYQAQCESRAANLPALPVQYSDYAAWQRETLQGQELQRLINYWTGTLSGAPTNLELPISRVRPRVQDFCGNRLGFSINSAIATELQSLGAGNNATLFMVVMAAFNILLFRYSQQEDILVGMPISNRGTIENQNLVGYFVNTLVVRTDLSGDPDFLTILQRVRNSASGAYAHQELPLEKIVEILRPERDPGRQPLFQVMLNFPDIDTSLSQPPDGWEIMFGQQRTSKFDLTLYCKKGPDGLLFEIEYASNLFDETAIKNFGQHFTVLLEAITKDPNKAISQLSLLTKQEHFQLITEWSGGVADYPVESLVHDLFMQQAERAPDAAAVVQNRHTLSYGELDRRSNQLAHYLRARGVKVEMPVGVFVERSFDWAVCLLAILKAGGCYVPLDLSYPEKRLDFMIRQARVGLVLSTTSLRNLLAETARIEVLDLNEDRFVISKQPTLPLPRIAEPANLAYILFTSGSTGRPKGVMVQHGSVVNYLRQMSEIVALDSKDSVLQVTSVSFDPSLREFFCTLTSGARLILLGPGEVNDPTICLRHIQEDDVSKIIGITPSLLKIILDCSGRAGFSGHRLSMICPSGEALEHSVRAKLLKTFGQQLTVINIYGPTETTLTCCALDPSCPPDFDTATVPIGQPMPNIKAYVLDSYGQLLPIGIPGELYIGGIGVGRGYVQQPDLTADRFVPSPFENGKRLYRTGDRVRWLKSGHLEFLGRSDHQVKIRGYRIELGEIEALLRNHPEIQDAAVIAREDEPGEKRLVAYLVWHHDLIGSLDQLRNYLAQLLPEYMVPTAFVVLEELPLTPNRKLDRSALPEPTKRPEAVEYVAPRSPIEDMLCRIWAELVRVEKVGIDDDFFELGGHSLLAMRMVVLIREALNVEVPLRAIFQNLTIAALATCIEEGQRTGAGLSVPPLMMHDHKDLSPSSFQQERLWFLDQLGLMGTAYNISATFRITGVLDEQTLERSFTELVSRHEILRTRFATTVQTIDPPRRCPVDIVDISDLHEEERDSRVRQRIQQEAEHRFDLIRGPLLRVCLLRLGPTDHVLLITMHHIISDGWSISIFLHELCTLYQADITGQKPDLPKLTLQYADYARWQREWLTNDVLNAHLAYWKQKLSNAPEILSLPLDRPRPAKPDYRGAHLSFDISPERLAGLEKIVREERATLYMLLLASFQLLLGRWSSQRDILVGAPIAGRHNPETEKLIGFFVNTVVIRTQLGENLTFRELLRNVKDVTIEAYIHQDMPFEKLVAELRPQRNLSMHPLFQVVFALQNIFPDELILPSLRVCPIIGEQTTVKFDLGLGVQESQRALRCYVKYASALFDHSTIKRFVGHWQTLLEAISADMTSSIWELPLLSKEERYQLLVEWNETEVSVLEHRFMHEMFEERAAQQPDAIALVYEDQHLSYGIVEASAQHLRNYLQEQGVRPETIVGLCVERSVRMIIGLLGILKSGGAYLPLDPSYPPDRLAFMLDDAQPVLVLSTTDLAKRLPDNAAVVCLDGSELRTVLRRPSVIRNRPDSGRANLLLPQHPAYVIYTSGSTGVPKGVVITHAGIPNLIAVQREKYAVTSQARILQFSSLSFDASFSEIARALTSGGQLVLVNSDKRTGDCLAKAIETHGITHISLPPAVLATLPEGTCGSLETLSVAGEACSGELVARWAKGRRMLNVYGPTEATVCVTVSSPLSGTQPPWMGRPISNTRLYVLDENMHLVPTGVLGELYVTGIGVARGYLKKPGLTAERFVPDPFSEHPGQRMYRTGDVVRWREDGNLEFIGRTDDQVKIRGFRIELGELEVTLRKHPWIAETAVQVREDVAGTKALVAYVVWGGKAGKKEVTELRHWLKQRLPEYLLPSAIVELDKLPLTPNGKVDRKALPGPTQRSAENDYAAPRTVVEKILADIWQEALHVERVGIHDDFFQLGGHSLLTMRVVSDIRDRLNIHIPVHSMFENPTIADLARRSEAGYWTTEELPVPPLIARKYEGPRPLSFEQEQLWFLDQLGIARAAYNMPAAFRVEGPLDAKALGQSFTEIVARHEILRTRFEIFEGQPMQVLDSPMSFRMEIAELSGLDKIEREARTQQRMQEEIERHLDLAREPLFRVCLLGLEPEVYVLLITMHHIISDGWSMGALMHELEVLYTSFKEGRKPQLPEPRIQYSDYAQWQREWLEEATIQKQLAYWKEKLKGAPPRLDVPTDRPRPANLSSRGAIVPFRIASEVLAGLLSLARQEGATLHMVLLAAAQLLLARWGGQRDIVVGAPALGRRYRETESMVGFFVNMLPMRTDLAGDQSFRELLQQVKQTVLGAYAHQDIPFARLVAELQPQRNLSLAPLFHIAFIYQNIPSTTPLLPGLILRPISGEHVTSKFDLGILIQEEASALRGEIEYATDLFDRSTIERLAGHMQKLLAEIVASPEISIWEIRLMDEWESRQLVVEWNQTAATFPAEKCIHDLFSERAHQQPEAIAVVYDADHISYGELERRSNQLAHYLGRQGAGPETIIALCIERSVEMLVGLLGILKAGASYLPLDPSYPEERLAYMIEDAQAAILLTQQRPLAVLPQRRPIVRIDEDWPRIAQQSQDPLKHKSDPDNLAYVIYTSGSTGKPKGCMVSHRPFINHALHFIKAYDLELGRRILQFFSLSFDASAEDIFPALLSGATVVGLPESFNFSQSEFLAFCTRHEITTLHLPVAFWHELVDGCSRYGLAPPESVRVLSVGGESPSLSKLALWDEAASRQISFRNLYGATEATITSTIYSREPETAMPGEGTVIPIGRPLSNVQLYLLDDKLNPVPSGFVGELYIGGVGVSRGYMRQPRLTAEKFIPDAFSDEPGARLYRTGDLARFLPNHEIEFLGRMDHQIKIRGFRVELAEIERVLTEIPVVRDAVVVVHESKTSDKRLAGYVLLKADQETTAEQLRHFLQIRLPDYMVPSSFLIMESFPLTSSGKIDRKSLPIPEQNHLFFDHQFVAPQTSLENTLARIWSSVLGVGRVGIYDNFFALGGHSLLATSMIARVRSELNIELPFRVVFESPALGEFAKRLETMLWLLEPSDNIDAETRDKEYEEGVL